MISPYYEDDTVRLFHGDCREVLPELRRQGITPVSCVTDPPYGETSATWDRWPDGWVAAVAAVLPPAASLWSYGSARMFLDHRDDFTGWRFAQEALWVKQRGSGPTTRDRLVKIHEWAYHWYRGPWGVLHHEWEREPYHGPDKSGRRLGDARGEHLGTYGPGTSYMDDGTRQPRSVTYVIESPSVRYQQRHQDEKPLATAIPLVRECTPPGELVLDCFAGSGTVGVAAKLTGRVAVLIEGDESMCAVAADRLEQEAQTMFAGGL